MRIEIDPRVDSITMPENLKVGLMVAEARARCGGKCDDDFSGFAFGQSPFHVPPPLAKALGRNADKGHYSAAEGIPELREAVAGFNKRHFGLDVDPGRIVIGPGTKDLIFTIFSMIKGAVIIPTPSWIGYYPQLRLMGKHYHPFRTKPENGFRIQPRDLDAALADLAHEKIQHLLVLNNPHNPTGVVYTEDELMEIARVCKRHNTIILADEIYALSTYRPEDFISMGKIFPEGTFVTNGLSKDRSAGGYRLGSCILPDGEPETLFADFAKIAATVYTNVSTPTQYAAVAAYEPNNEIDEYLRVTRDIHRMMGLYFSRAFNQIEGIRATIPQGAFYFYTDFNALADNLMKKGIQDSNSLGQSLLSHPFHVATVTGDAVMLRPDDFGARIAFVDYEGKKAFDNYLKSPPQTPEEENQFVEANAPRMIQGVEKLKDWVDFLVA